MFRGRVIVRLALLAGLLVIFAMGGDPRGLPLLLGIAAFASAVWLLARMSRTSIDPPPRKVVATPRPAAVQSAPPVASQRGGPRPTPTDVYRAVSGGGSIRLKAMLDLGASATWVDRGNKRTLLHSAANQGRADIARTLIDHGALLDAKDREGWTPLHLACFYGKTATATTLLLAGANPNSIDKMGQAPIHMAAMKGFDDIVSILVQSGADPSASDRSGWTARSLAEQYKHMAVLEALL